MPKPTGIVIDVTHQKIHEGNCFTSNIVFLDVLNTQKRYVRYKANEQSMHVVFQIGVEGKFYFKTYEGTTYTDDGTIVDAFNRIVGGGKPQDSYIYRSPIVNVLGTQRGDRVINAGKGGTATGGSGGSRLESIILPGQELLLEVENASGQLRDVEFIADFYQVKR